MPWRGKWATERGGALLGHAIHAHDMLCYVLGPARRVFAYTATRVNQIEVEDCAADGARDGRRLGGLAGRHARLGRRDHPPPLLVQRPGGREQHAAVHQLGRPVDVRRRHARADRSRSKPTLAEFQPLPEHYAGQFYRFYDALRARAPSSPVTLADARVSLELITAMYYSAETGPERHPADRHRPPALRKLAAAKRISTRVFSLNAPEAHPPPPPALEHNERGVTPRPHLRTKFRVANRETVAQPP